MTDPRVCSDPKGAQAQNDKVEHLAENIESLGGTVMTLLEKFV